MKSASFLVLVALIASTPAAAASRVAITAHQASSTHAEENAIAYDATRTTDGKLGTAWVEGKDGSGLGEWLELDLGSEKEIDEIRVWGGLWFSQDMWTRANRPRQIEIEFSDGTTATMNLADAMEPGRLALPAPKQTSKVRLRISQVYAGTTWLDTAISEVQVYDSEPSATAPVRTARASTVMSDDGDGSYAPANLSDGITDSMWCEGAAEDGAGEWVELQFSGAQRVSKVTLVNGMGSGLPLWMKANRAARATLQFSDGSTQDVALKNTMLPQEVAFDPRTTTSVKMTFTEVVRGKEYNDLCISEARFE